MNSPLKPLTTTWTEQQVRALAGEQECAYHRMELPYGIVVPGDDRRPTARQIFTEDLTGKSVLDIGCNDGFMCFEAARRGAKRVLGVDVAGERIDRARRTADCLGLDVEFRVLDIETEPLDEMFDYILCLNVTHHMRYPIATLHRLMDMTRDKLILEVAALGRRDAKKLGIGRLAAWWLNRLPLLVVGDSGLHARHSGRGFLITAKAIERMLRWHRNVCARVDSFPSQFKKRFIAVAHKRQFDQMLLVAGPPAAGKSTFTHRLRQGDAPLKQAIGGLDAATWPSEVASRLHKVTEPHLPGFLLEYNILHPFLGAAKSYARDEAMEIVDCAKNVTAVTLWVSPADLLKHVDQREATVSDKADADQFNQFHEQLRHLYRQPAEVAAMYRRWWDYARGRFAKHIILSLSDGVTRMSDEQFESALAELEAAPPR